MIVAAKERGVPFSPPMVRALRADRKWMTRRLVKPAPTWNRIGYDHSFWNESDGLWTFLGRRRDGLHHPLYGPIKPPYGPVGTTAYIKEALYRDADGMARYVADDAIVMCELGPAPWTWKPKALASMYMPRWAARDRRIIESYRVERLQAISEADAKAEGVEASEIVEMADGSPCYTLPFQNLWKSINGIDNPAAWDSNPFVWVISFRRLNS